MTNEIQNPVPHPKSELADCFLLIALVATFAHLVQAALQPLLVRVFATRPELAFCAVLAVFAAMASAFLVAPALRAIASSRAFAAAVMLALAPAVIIGMFTVRLPFPGSSAPKNPAWLEWPMRFLFADDLFHSYWFTALLMLMAAGLSAGIFRAGFAKPRRWGLVVAHFAVLLILLGGLIGVFFGSSGRLRLAPGETVSRFIPDKGTGDAECPLGFELRLDNFRVEWHVPRFNVLVLRCLSRDDLREVATMDAGAPGSCAMLDDGTAVTVAKPPDAATARHFMRFQPGTTDETDIEIELNGSYDLKGCRIKVLEFLPDCRYDPATRAVLPSSDEPRNPVALVEITQPAQDGNPRVERRWLLANFPGFDIGEGAVSSGISLNYIHQRPNVSAELSVEHSGVRQDVRLPEMQTVFVAGGKYALRLSEKRDLRDCVSEVSVMENGKATGSGTIRINRPFSHGGFTFIQSDFDSTAVGRSGMKVVKHPGMPLVYVGFGLLAAGLVCTLVIAQFSKRKTIV